MSKFTLDWKQYAALARQAAAEGCVLLENKNNTLPLAEGETCAVFGRTQFEYYKSGTGSGGLVNTSYVHDLDYALTESSLIIDEEVKTAYKNWLKDHPFDLGNGWAQEPWCQVEMPLSDELVSGAASRCQTALIVIGRTAGEDRDNAAEKGSWYLTDAEEAMLEIVCRHFSRTVVILNVGNIIDMSFVDRYEPSSVLYIWQGLAWKAVLVLSMSSPERFLPADASVIRLLIILMIIHLPGILAVRIPFAMKKISM